MSQNEASNETSEGCAFCGGPRVTESIDDDQLPVLHIDDDQVTTLTVQVPVLTCGDCGQQWTDYRSESIRDNAARNFNCARAWAYSQNNLKTISKSENCGCFHCLKIFHPKKIKEWVDGEETATCPYCDIDSVIGSASGCPINQHFLKLMHEYWFS